MEIMDLKSANRLLSRFSPISCFLDGSSSSSSSSSASSSSCAVARVSIPGCSLQFQKACAKSLSLPRRSSLRNFRHCSRIDSSFYLVRGVRVSAQDQKKVPQVSAPPSDLKSVPPASLPSAPPEEEARDEATEAVASTSTESDSTVPASRQAKLQGDDSLEDSVASSVVKIKRSLAEAKASKPSGLTAVRGFLDGVVEETRLIEWPSLRNVVRTTGVVLTIIFGSSVVVLTVNAILAELSDKIFNNPAL